jgi:hypothetical protein
MLASVLVALAVKAFIQQPFITIEGRRLTIHLAQLPALAAWRDLWTHLQHLTFETVPGALRIGFDIRLNSSQNTNLGPHVRGLPGMGGGRDDSRVKDKMREWIEAQLANGLPAFAGTSVSGTIALHQDLLNTLLSNFLAQAPTAGVKPPLDLKGAMTTVKSAAIRVEPGTVFVDFRIAI